MSEPKQFSKRPNKLKQIMLRIENTLDGAAQFIFLSLSKIKILSLIQSNKTIPNQLVKR